MLTRVVVVDPVAVFRFGVVRLLAEVPGVAVVGEAATQRAALRVVDRVAADWVIVGASQESAVVLKLVAALQARRPRLRVVVLLPDASLAARNSLLAGGVAAVISKRLGCRPLLVKLRGLFESHDVAPAQVAEEARAARRARIRTGTGAIRDSELSAANLTQREREVLSALAQGLSNRAIGQKLGVVEGTIKVHVRNVLRKLNLDSRLAAALWAAGHLRSGRSGVRRENKAL